MKSPINSLNFSSKPRLRPILQAEAAECGLACLAMMANYYGHVVNLNTLRAKLSVSLKGANLLTLVNMAEKLNLISRPLRLEMSDLVNLTTPCIIHWDLNHFVVLKKASRKSIVIIDPAYGEKSLSMNEAAKHFTGVAIEFTPSKKFETKIEEKRLGISDLWESIKGLKRGLTHILVLSLFLQIFAMASPFYLQLIIDDVIVNNDGNLLLTLAMGFFLVMLINSAVSAMRSLLILILGTQISTQIANNLFHHLVRLPLEWFEKRHIGDVVSRFSSLNQIKEMLTTGVVEAIIDGAMVMGTLIMMFIYSSFLAWVVICTAAIYSFIRIASFRSLRQRNEEYIIANASEDSSFMETVRAIQTIKIYGEEVQRQRMWHNSYINSMNANIKVGKLNIGFATINNVLFGLENILVIYLAALMVTKGHMSIGMLIAFLAYKQQFTEKAVSLITKLVQFKMIGLHLSRISDIALTKIESDNDSIVDISTSDQVIDGSIQLSNISFRYSPDEKLVVDRVNTTIESGSSVVITGPSGCGKTTLIKIMMGLLKPETGNLLINNIDIEQIGTKFFRKNIAAVMQNDKLLSGTISDNICFFSEDVDYRKIEECAKLASIHSDIIKMPMGYNSLIGDMGSTLSGGQQQRVILARALYREPKILFLDEATSHLNVELESFINDNIKQMKITRIIVAHRPETIRSADRVLVMNNGILADI